MSLKLKSLNVLYIYIVRQMLVDGVCKEINIELYLRRKCGSWFPFAL